MRGRVFPLQLDVLGIASQWLIVPVLLIRLVHLRLFNVNKSYGKTKINTY